MLPHDLPVDFLVTPSRSIATRPAHPRPRGIYWDLLRAAQDQRHPAAAQAPQARRERRAVAAPALTSAVAPRQRRRAARAAPGARSAAAARPAARRCPSRSIQAASTPAACAAPTSSAKVSPTRSAVAGRDVEHAERGLHDAAGCGLRSPSASDTTTASTRARMPWRCEDLVGGAGVVEVAHDGQPVTARAARRAAPRATAEDGRRPRARGGARARAPRRPRRRRAASQPTRASARRKRSRDGSSTCSRTRRCASSPRSRPPARARTPPRSRPARSASSSVAEGAERRADRRAADRAAPAGVRARASTSVPKRSSSDGRGSAACVTAATRASGRAGERLATREALALAMPERAPRTRRTASTGAPARRRPRRGSRPGRARRPSAAHPSASISCTTALELLDRARAPRAARADQRRRSRATRRDAAPRRPRVRRSASSASAQRCRRSISIVRRGTSAFASLDREGLGARHAAETTGSPPGSRGVDA